MAIADHATDRRRVSDRRRFVAPYRWPEWRSYGDRRETPAPTLRFGD